MRKKREFNDLCQKSKVRHKLSDSSESLIVKFCTFEKKKGVMLLFDIERAFGAIFFKFIFLVCGYANTMIIEFECK